MVSGVGARERARKGAWVAARGRARARVVARVGTTVMVRARAGGPAALPCLVGWSGARRAAAAGRAASGGPTVSAEVGGAGRVLCAGVGALMVV